MSPKESIGAALAYLASRQSDEGSWRGAYGGPLFLLPMYVACAHILGLELDDATRDGMVRYLRNHQRDDGGWGLHVEGHSHVFTSVLGYVALRLLGVPPDDRDLRKAQEWFLPRGGAKTSAPWGKFTLALLNLYHYDGLHPMLPELWLLPRALPVHPSRLWCHCRMVYLPMAWLYGTRASVPRTQLVETLRREIYDEPYDGIDWPRCRQVISPTDEYVSDSGLLKAGHRVLEVVERGHRPALRRRALDHVLDQIRQEDANTNWICIGPINKLLNTLVWHFARPGGAEVQQHVARLPDYLWRADEGITMQGYNSSELWDTAFAVQAIVASGRMEEHRDVLARAHRFIEQAQVLEDTPSPQRYYRHRSKGGWPFSTRAHGWPISDCTAEGLKASLLLQDVVTDSIPRARLEDATEEILSLQNRDGGWATYELTRGPRWLELLNPSACFADIMIDYSYVECTSACVQALSAFRARYPDVRRVEVDRAIERGTSFIRGVQRTDGSWEGSWGVCFTYGTWFGVWGLRAAGALASDPAVERACSFLTSWQRTDGSWSETVESCRRRRYVEAQEGQTVMTSWAVLTLLRGHPRHVGAIDRGIQFLRSRQGPDGSWPPEHIAGVFNKTCGIHYDNYLKIFPLWALALAEGYL